MKRQCPPDLGQGVFDTLAALVDLFVHEDIEYAVGGAVAMYVAGYKRSTTDVDFFLYGDREEEIIETLKDDGCKPRRVADSHWIVQLPKYKGTDIRADLLFAWGPPETAAIFGSVTRNIGGVEFQAFPPEYIVASKATVLPGTEAYFKSKQDIGAMLARKLFKPDDVRRLMRAEDVPYLSELNEILAEVQATQQNPSSAWPTRGSKRRGA